MSIPWSAGRAACGLLLSACVAGPQAVAEPWNIRVLPQAVAMNSEPFRLGMQVSLFEGHENPLSAECFSDDSLVAEAGATVTPGPDLNTGRKVFRVACAGDTPSGVILTSAALRKNVGYTVRVRCRRVGERGTLKLSFVPVSGIQDKPVERSFSVKGSDFVSKSVAVKPRSDGAFRCAFRLSPGCSMEFEAFSLLPDDAVEGFDGQKLEALRAVGAGDLCWPVPTHAGCYNWYDGVGPHALRRAVSPVPGAGGQDFGTVEFASLCRLIRARPLMRVTVFQTGCAEARVENQEAAVRLAADWVAYCNATNGHPLAELRTRHGHAESLGVLRWELAAAGGGRLAGAVCRAYAEAMKAECPVIEVGVALEGGDAGVLEEVLREAGEVLDFVSSELAGARERVMAYNLKQGRRIRVAATCLQGDRDRHVAQVLGRLEAGDAADRHYFGAWYDSLAVTYEALELLSQGGAVAVCAPVSPEQILCRVPYAKHMLDETGLLFALFNRFPALVPLVTEGAPAEKGSPFRVQAAWTEDPGALVAYIYNSDTETRQVRLDLTALKRSFCFWVSEQIAADLTARRTGAPLPVSRRQKAGAAMTQVILCEAAPASFTRIVVKE